MRIIYFALFNLMKGLIAIGDGVIFLGNAVVFHPIKRVKAKLFTLSLKKEHVLLTRKTKKKKGIPSFIFPSIKFLKVALPSFTIRLPKQAKKQKVVQKVVTKPRPVGFSHVAFWVKCKYFFAGTTFSLIFIFFPLLSLIFLQDLPNPKTLTLGQIPQTTKIYDRNGTLLYQIYAGENRTLVPLSDIPDYLQKATIATEDKDFYKHPGFDISAIIRSAVENASGKDLQGGSTLTQQLIKSALLTPETTLIRKTKEAILAFWAERIYTKKQILEMYFNQIPYGGTAWGVEAAADVYFGKHVKDLTLAESAFLAGIPRAPSIYSPFGSTPDAWKKRQKEVLKRMVAMKYITQKQAEDALTETLTFQKPQTPIYAPHFVMYVKEFLVKKYGLPMVERGGLNVITSLDLPLQEATQEIVTDQVNKDAYLNLSNGAALIVNPKNGDVLTMVGSKEYNDANGGANNLTTALRQPGSSIKILTYSAALSMGATAATIIDDAPTTFRGDGGPAYSPVNYDGKFHGRVPLRLALANSYNIPAVKMLNQVGVPTMIDLGKKMGMKSWRTPDQYGLSITLGAAEATMIDMANLYAVHANGGERVDINPILKITDGKGNIVEEKPQNPQGQRVLDAGIAYIVSNILSDNSSRAQAFGSNSILNIPGKTVSVKTGTTDWKKDNWTIGYTPSIVVATWVGNNDGAPMSQSLASGITGAAPMWHRIMTMVLKDKADEIPALPENVVQKPCLGRLEYFIRGTENSVSCAFIPKKKEEKKEEIH